MHHGVHGDVVIELAHLGGRRQLAVKQQIADLEEVALFSQLFDGVAAIEQYTLVAVDIGGTVLQRCAACSMRPALCW